MPISYKLTNSLKFPELPLIHIAKIGIQCLQLWLIVCSAMMVLSLTNLEGEESFDASMLGQAEEVVQDRVSDDELVFIKG